MQLLFELILFTSIWCLGLTIATQEGMVFYSVRTWLENVQWANVKYKEPLLLCHWCMPSIHTIIGYVFAFGLGLLSKFDYRLFVMYPLVVMGSSLVNGIVWTLYQMMESKSRYYNEKTDSIISNYNNGSE